MKCNMEMVLFSRVSFMAHTKQEHHIINKRIFCLKMLILGIIILYTVFLFYNC